jgi:hypothetical protein
MRPLRSREYALMRIDITVIRYVRLTVGFLAITLALFAIDQPVFGRAATSVCICVDGKVILGAPFDFSEKQLRSTDKILD